MDNLTLQAHHHPLESDERFRSLAEYVNHLMHRRAYEEVAGLAAGKACLDWGCNAGYGIERLLTTASSAAGLDVSPRAVDAASEKLRGRADVRLYDGVRSDFVSESFDLITSFQVIEHVADYDAYFSEITRLLRPDGTAVFTTPNAVLRLDPGMKPWYEFHVREFRPPELRELLETQFESVEIRGLFAADELYWIERSRYDRARRAARQGARMRQAVKDRLRESFPWLVPARDRLRRLLGRTPEEDAEEEVDCSRFSTADFFYRADGLDEALDLMAICRKPRLGGSRATTGVPGK